MVDSLLWDEGLLIVDVPPCLPTKFLTVGLTVIVVDANSLVPDKFGYAPGVTGHWVL